MTKEEAALFLSVGEGEDLQDVYEQKLFEHKQFFLSKFPVSRVVNSRLKKLEQLHKAYLLLGGNEKAAEQEEMSFAFQGDMLDVFNKFQQEQSERRSALSRAVTYQEVRNHMHAWLRLIHDYATCWNSFSPEDVEGIIIGKEPDPMEIYTGLKKLSEQGIVKFESLREIRNENPVRREAKRLSLWLKMESDE